MKRKNVSEESKALVPDDEPIQVQVAQQNSETQATLNPVIQILLVGMLLLTYASSVYAMPLEINIMYFSCSIIYIGSVKSLDQYSLKNDKESVNNEKSWLSLIFSTTKSIWLFPLISSIFLMGAYVMIKTQFYQSMHTLLLFFVG